MFVRFADEGDRGLFQIAYELERDSALSRHESKVVGRLIEWFEWELPAPPAWAYSEDERVVCRAWFKAGAREMIERAWELAGVAGDHGIEMTMRRAGEVGDPRYEDRYQVVVWERVAAALHVNGVRLRWDRRDRRSVRNSAPPRL